MGIYESGTSIRLKATIEDELGTKVDPDGQDVTVRVYGIDNIKIDEQTATRDALGEYYINFTIPEYGERGTWYHEWEFLYSGNTIIGRKTFIVVHTGKK